MIKCNFIIGVFIVLGLVTTLNAAAAEQTAVFAGGRFWGVDAAFKHVTGVSDVVSGYSGGSAATAHYEMVSKKRNPSITHREIA